MIKKIIITILIIINFQSYADDTKLNNVEASYVFYYKNIKAGTMHLKINNNKDKIKISTIYDGNFLAEIANRGYREEISYIVKKKNNLIPEKYIYKDNKESYEVTFSNNNIKILFGNKNSTNFESKIITYDPISMLVVLIKDFPKVKNSYHVLSKKNIKIYNYSYKNNSSIIIKNKKYKGFSAEYVSGNKTNYFFFSKEHKNLMVFTSIKKKGKEKIRIELSEIKLLN